MSLFLRTYELYSFSVQGSGDCLLQMTNLTLMMTKRSKVRLLRLQSPQQEVCRDDQCAFDAFTTPVWLHRLIRLLITSAAKKVVVDEEDSSQEDSDTPAPKKAMTKSRYDDVPIALGTHLIHDSSNGARKKPSEEEEIDEEINGLLDGDLSRDSIFDDDDEEEEDEVNFLLADED
jgi:hypothetical protein